MQHFRWRAHQCQRNAVNYAMFSSICIIISNLKFAIAMFYTDFTMRYDITRCTINYNYDI